MVTIEAFEQAYLSELALEFSEIILQIREADLVVLEGSLGNIEVPILHKHYNITAMDNVFEKSSF